MKIPAYIYLYFIYFNSKLPQGRRKFTQDQCWVKYKTIVDLTSKFNI